MLDEDTPEASDSDLHNAAGRLGVVLVGHPTRSYFSLASKVTRDDAAFWLRVRRSHLLKWTPLHNLGYEQSDAIHGVPKPVVVDRAEWLDASHVVRAELLTYISDPVITAGLHLKSLPYLPETWWSDLRSAIKHLAQTPTARDTSNVLSDVPWMRQFYGADIPSPTEWATEHEDPHWGNLTGPGLHILDWDFWGRQPRGFTVAGLYCTSLAVPEVSDRIWREFADVLESPSGRWSVLYHFWYRRRGLPSFLAWERGAHKAREIVEELVRK